jgi:hypothetical protein
MAVLFLRAMGRVVDETESAAIARSWLDEWLLGKLLAQTFGELGMDDGAAWRAVALVKILLAYGDLLRQPYPALDALLADIDVQVFLGVNRHLGRLWFNQESFEELVSWLGVISRLGKSPADGRRVAEAWLIAAREAGFQVEKLLLADTTLRATGYTECRENNAI